VTGERRPARNGDDFYWTDGGGVNAQPVFYSELEVTSTTRVGGNSDYYPNGGLPDNRPGYVSTNYDNGHSKLAPIPLEEWNPPLAQWNSLPADERRPMLLEYMESRGLDFITNGDPNAIGTYESDDLRAYLISKGVTGDTS
jgi:hypothetical protein